jgi:hypothetical protein
LPLHNFYSSCYLSRKLKGKIMLVGERSLRPNAEMSKVVELGVSLLQSRGRAFASEFLVRRNIPVNVIVRVLSDPPGRRRAGQRR